MTIIEDNPSRRLGPTMRIYDIWGPCELVEVLNSVINTKLQCYFAI